MATVTCTAAAYFEDSDVDSDDYTTIYLRKIMI